MSSWFSIEVRFLNGRYHGRDANTAPAWPPTPLRLFQAVVAGALSGRWAREDRPRTEAVLRWLERLGAPRILAAPQARQLSAYRLAVPHNQADLHIDALRRGEYLDGLLAGDKELKALRPWLVGRAPLIYAWFIDDDLLFQEEAIRAVVRRLVVLGTGLDHAAADGRITAVPPDTHGLLAFACGVSPCEGTLDSLMRRHDAELTRLATGSLRENRPSVRYRLGEPTVDDGEHLLFALRTPTEEPDSSLPFDPKDTAMVAQAVRLSLADKLSAALHRNNRMSASSEQVARLVTGRGADGSDSAGRLHVSPLPSIGHQHADGLLRRVLVSVPIGFPIAPLSVQRALSDLEIEVEVGSSQRAKCRLVPLEAADADEGRMRDRYLGTARVWRSVSPVILPGQRGKGQIVRDSPSVGRQRVQEVQARDDARRRLDEAALFRRALAHASVGGVAGYQLRREPFDQHQPRADASWRLPPSKADPRRIWLAGRPRVHAQITFDKARSGPILIGDGRFLGLGLFSAATSETPGWPEVARYRLDVRGRPRVEQTVRVGDVLRQALMSGGFPPSELSGHDDLGPLRDPAHCHAFFLPEDADGDGLIDHLTVYSRLGFSDEGLERLRRLSRLWWRIRHSGRQTEVALHLQEVGSPTAVPGLQRLVGPSRIWRSATPYFRPRFSKKRDFQTGLAVVIREQIRREWSLRFPDITVPDVELLKGREFSKFESVRVDRERFAADTAGSFLQLRFDRPIEGPIALGRSCHFGLGLFVADP